MKMSKEARRDAYEYARAQMYYGEGAGTRRKLINATVEQKINRDPAYGRAFRDELARQDMAEHAVKARRERRRADTSQFVGRNVRAVTSRNYQNMSTGLAIAASVAYLAHQSGLDKKVWDASKRKYYELRLRYERFRRPIRVVKNDKES